MPKSMLVYTCARCGDTETVEDGLPTMGNPGCKWGVLMCVAAVTHDPSYAGNVFVGSFKQTGDGIDSDVQYKVSPLEICPDCVKKLKNWFNKPEPKGEPYHTRDVRTDAFL